VIVPRSIGGSYDSCWCPVVTGLVALRRAAAGAEDIAILLLITILVPVVILLIGAPFALLAWIVATIVRQF